MTGSARETRDSREWGCTGIDLLFDAGWLEEMDDDLVSEDFGFPADRGIPQQTVHRLNKDLFHLSSSRLRHTAQTKPWTDDI